MGMSVCAKASQDPSQTTRNARFPRKIRHSPQIPQEVPCAPKLVIFFSFTEALLPDPTPTPPRPHPDPIQHPETDPKQTRNGAKTDPKRTETEPKWVEIKPGGEGRARGLVAMGGFGGHKGKIKSPPKVPHEFQLNSKFLLRSGVALANQTKKRAKTKSS